MQAWKWQIFSEDFAKEWVEDPIVLASIVIAKDLIFCNAIAKPSVVWRTISQICGQLWSQTKLIYKILCVVVLFRGRYAWCRVLKNAEAYYYSSYCCFHNIRFVSTSQVLKYHKISSVTFGIKGSFTRCDSLWMRPRFFGIAHCNRTEWVWNPIMCNLTHTQSHHMNSIIDIHTTNFLSQSHIQKSHRVNEP